MDLDWLILMLLATNLILFSTNIVSERRNAGHRDAASRIARLERKVEFLVNHLGYEEELGSWTAQYRDKRFDTVKELVKKGRKIEAIKLYREETGAGLKEAKEAVEEMQVGL